MRFKCLIYLAIAVLSIGFAQAQNLPERKAVRHGNKAYLDSKYAEAAEDYNKALKLAPGNFEATYNLGNALYKSEQYEKALKPMTAAAADSLRSDEERAMAYYNLGNAQFQQQKYEDALKSYKSSLLLNPADQEAKYNYALTKSKLEEQQNQDQNQDQNQNQDQQDEGDQDQEQNQDQNQDEGDQEQDQDQNQGDEEQDQDQQDQEGQPEPQGIDAQEQEQMLNAIQAQEDRTQEKLDEEAKALVVPGRKNW